MKLNMKTLGLGLVALFLARSAKGQIPSPVLIIPKDGTRMTLTELRALAESVGFPDVDLAAAVAMAESGGVEGAVGDKGTSFGLWQVHSPAHPKYQRSLLLTAYYNAQAAFEISSGGVNWTPWTTYRTGAFKKFMPQAIPAHIAMSEGEAVPKLEEPDDLDEKTETDVIAEVMPAAAADTEKRDASGSELPSFLS